MLQGGHAHLLFSAGLLSRVEGECTCIRTKRAAAAEFASGHLVKSLDIVGMKLINGGLITRPGVYLSPFLILPFIYMSFSWSVMQYRKISKHNHDIEQIIPQTRSIEVHATATEFNEGPSWIHRPHLVPPPVSVPLLP